MRTTRSVSRESYAFTHFPRALQGSALRLTVDDPFDAGVSAFVIEEQPLGTPIPFQLQLGADVGSLAHQAGVSTDSVSLSVVLLSPELKRNEVLVSWRQDQVPRDWNGAVPVEGFGERRVSVALVCHLNRTLERSLAKPWRNGSVLARRVFTISLPAHSSLFQVAWESFSAMEWEPEALWKVDFKITEGFHEQEPEAAVALYANKDLPAFHRLLAPGAARNPKLSVTARILLRTVAAMIAADISVPVLSDLRVHMDGAQVLIDDVNEESLTGKILGLVAQMKMDPSEAMRLAVEEPDKLRHRIQGTLRVGSTLDQRALDRILA